MVSWCRLLLLLLMGIVLSPLRAAAATVPMLFAYDVGPCAAQDVRPGGQSRSSR